VTTDEEIKKVAQECGALVDNDHVILNSWEHSSGYFLSANLYYQPDKCRLIAAAMVRQLKDFSQRTSTQLQAIVGPLDEGGLWSRYFNLEWESDYFSKLPFAFTRWIDDLQEFVVQEDSGRDDRKLVEGKNVVVVNDVLSTGITLRPTIEAVRKAGGNPVVAAVICDRRTPDLDLEGLGVISLLQFDWPVWTPDECPLCPQVPINPNFGNGGKYRQFQKLLGSLDLLGGEDHPFKTVAS
jgi:orotate phosphoribosyltransferase